jgi:capsular polysaccharide biosynthesis protein
VKRLLSIASRLPLARRAIFRADELKPAVAPGAIGTVVAAESRPFVMPFPREPRDMLRFASEPPDQLEFPRAEIIETIGAEVKTEGGIVLHDGRVVFWGAERGAADSTVVKYATRFSPRVLRRRVTVDGTAVCFSHTNPANYFHFILDLSSQLQVCRMLDREPERVVVLGELRDWQRDALATYGYTGDRVLTAPGAANLRFERLWLVRPANFKLDPADNVWLYRPDVLDAHRRQLEVGSAAPTRSRRLYITRGESYRHLQNEDAAVSLLAPAGFDVVDPGTLSLAGQIEAFRSAEAVVGAHGAGLTNLLFAEPPCEVAEILTPDWLSPPYAHLSALRNLTYTPLIGGRLDGESYAAPLAELERWVAGLPQ